MSFDNDYPNRKDRRHPYHGSAAVDRSCRPGGDCPWCEGTRKAKERRRKEAAIDQLTEELTEFFIEEEAAGRMERCGLTPDGRQLWRTVEEQ